ncbi:MAG: hypothetical protein AB1791_12525 [Chloroflexota bacterium]
MCLGYRLAEPAGAQEPAANDREGQYQFWCSTCHGDRGQGLTDEWRSNWPAEEQNCWQSKCHAANHPPGGFVFPKTVPALIGPTTLTRFENGQALYVYVQAAMPYWSPGLLSAEQYLAITTFLVESNYAARGLTLPDPWPADLATVPLQPPIAAEPSPPSILPSLLMALVIAAGLALSRHIGKPVRGK